MRGITVQERLPRRRAAIQHADVAIGSECDAIRTDWLLDEVQALFAEPFSNLLYRAHGLHRYWFDPTEVQISTLLSIKTGACPEDCAYCPQSIRYDTGLEDEPLMSLDEVIRHARAAREKGATRFCMGAAYRSPKPTQLEQIAAMVAAVSDLGMETCATLGMLSVEQAGRYNRAYLGDTFRGKIAPCLDWKTEPIDAS